jgi:dTMP kinase
VFIALEGTDGSGKSTLAPLVADLLGPTPAVFRSKLQMADGTNAVAQRMATLRHMLWPMEGISDFLDYPSQYWVMLQGAWYTMASTFTVGPLLAGGRTVILDGWCYKFMAKARLDPMHPALLESVFAEVLVPDLVVHLVTDLEAVYDRDPRFTFHELGGYQDYATRGRDSFVEHQTRVRQQIREIVPRDRLIELPIDCAAEPQRNAAKVVAAIEQRLVVSR